LGPHALQITELGKLVEEEVLAVRASGEIVLVEDKGLLAVVFRLDAVRVLDVLEAEEMRCTGPYMSLHVIIQREK
jgi:hypothetical protein